jgi:hypothetical protein
VVVPVEYSKATVEERRNAILTLLQIAQHQATQEITQTDMEVHGSVTGETVICVDDGEGAPSFSTTDSLSASKPGSPKRPKNSRVERRESWSQNRSRLRTASRVDRSIGETLRFLVFLSFWRTLVKWLL